MHYQIFGLTNAQLELLLSKLGDNAPAVHDRMRKSRTQDGNHDLIRLSEEQMALIWNTLKDDETEEAKALRRKLVYHPKG